MPASGRGDVALSMRAVRKSFGPVVALDDVTIEVRAGEVHALVGENGAGKSTLVKILAGVHTPDSGELALAGHPFRPRGPLDALERGVAMIYQELNLAPHLSIEENVLLGREPARCGWLDKRERRARVTRALAVLEHADLDPGERVASLSPGARQLVEIARALVGEPAVLVLDEPTSSLAGDDVERLFRVIGALRERGVAIVYISHFLDELTRIADRYTVLRDGRSVASGAMAGTTVATIVAAMAGRALAEHYPRVPHVPGEVVLELQGLSGRALPYDVDLVLRRGELFGIAGLVGAGRTELLRALFGLDPIRSGRVLLAGVTAEPGSPAARLRQGIGLLSEDRKGEGLAVARSVGFNLTLSRLEPFGRVFSDRRARDECTQGFVDRLGIRCRDPRQRIAELSGGNQQKVALARLLHHDVDVLLLDEPTRGIDVASKVEIYRTLGELAARGKAAILVSSYLPELIGICDTIAVARRGRLGAARPARDWTETALLAEATGAEVVA